MWKMGGKKKIEKKGKSQKLTISFSLCFLFKLFFLFILARGELQFNTRKPSRFMERKALFLCHFRLLFLQLIPNSAWKDYSANTNYAFDAYNEHEEKHNGKARNGANSRTSTATMHNGLSQQTTLQMSHSPNKSQYYDISRNGNRYGNGEHQSR
jgi:hypothetical protein